MELEKLPALFSPAEAKMPMKANANLFPSFWSPDPAGEDPGSPQWNPVKREQGPVHAVSAALEFDTNGLSLRPRRSLIIAAAMSPSLEDAWSTARTPLFHFFEPLEEELLPRVAVFCLP